MTTETNPRQALIDAYSDVHEALGDYERGRITRKEVVPVWHVYCRECRKLGEGLFILEDFMDMTQIPVGYPEIPCDLPTVGGGFDTPLRKEKEKAISELIKNIGLK